jgi:hypothetical protein
MTPAADNSAATPAATEAASNAIPGLGSALQGKPGATPAEPAVETERVAAEKGVGAKGRSLDGESGLLVEPVKAFFSVQEKLAFEVQLKQAMDLYKATNGALPKSHDEFMAQVVKANNINLPELPAGHKYVYDPQQGELQVERPK